MLQRLCDHCGMSVSGTTSQSILVVDDEKFIRDIIADFLTMEGYVVRTAEDGAAAADELRRARFDLVISDLKMPRMDGIQLFIAIRQRHPAMADRVLFVTGDVIGPDAERFLADSRCRWLAKPFRLNELLRLAKEVMARR